MMNLNRNPSRRTLALLTFGLISSAPVLAADLPAFKDAPAPVLAPAPSDWRFEVTINGWAPSMISDTGVHRFPTASADVGFFTLLDHLYFNLPVSFVARNWTSTGFAWGRTRTSMICRGHLSVA